MYRRKFLFVSWLWVVGPLVSAHDVCAQKTVLNVSYDPTRESYQEFNAAFAKHWKAKTSETVSIKQAHGGSGSQARAVIDGHVFISSENERYRALELKGDDSVFVIPKERKVFAD